jgi:hypothetical protein
MRPIDQKRPRNRHEAKTTFDQVNSGDGDQDTPLRYTAEAEADMDKAVEP